MTKLSSQEFIKMLYDHYLEDVVILGKTIKQDCFYIKPDFSGTPFVTDLTGVYKTVLKDLIKNGGYIIFADRKNKGKKIKIHNKNFYYKSNGELCFQHSLAKINNIRLYDINDIFYIDFNIIGEKCSC